MMSFLLNETSDIFSSFPIQDLKDHMKQAGEIIYSTVNRKNAREG